MKPYRTFAEYVSLQDAERRAEPGLDAPVAERSITGGMFKAVNPARPISPTNSRLLSFPGQRRIKSQIMGR
jgi:hypothetical protein